MSVIATAVRHLIAAGVTGDALIEAIAEMEADLIATPKPRSAGAIRTERWRERKRHEASQVTESDACDGSDAASALDKESPPHPQKKLIPSPPIVPPKRAKSVPAKPDDVSDQTWQDWTELRRKKRAPVTDGVIEGARREAAKLGWTLDRTLSEWVFRGSQGFQAEWITDGRSKAASGDDYLAGYLARAGP